MRSIRLKCITVAVVLLAFGLVGKGQFIPLLGHYSQHGLQINPAIAGSREVFTTAVSYREQWMQFGAGRPQTLLASAHTPLKNDLLSVGGYLLHDEIGVSSLNAVVATLAYRLPINPLFSDGSEDMARISLGVSAGLSYHKTRWSEVDLVNDQDPSFALDDVSESVPSIGAGVYYQDKKSFASFSIPTLLERVYYEDGTISASYQMSALSLYAMGGYRMQTSDKILLQPSFLFKSKGLSFNQFEATLMGYWDKKFGGGLAWRSNNSLSFLVSAQPIPQLNVILSYDHTVGRVATIGASSLELTLNYDLKFFVKTEDPRFF